MTREVENELFTAREEDGVAVVRLQARLVRQLTDLNLKEGLFKYLHTASDSKTIKVLVLVGNPEKIKRNEMLAFIEELCRSRENLNRLARIYNAINQLILYIRGMPKMVIHADSGEVLSLFLNLSLACDYRIVGDQTVFQHPTVDLGLVPKGGGIYFLSRIVGYARTMELILSGRNLTAREAFDLGIVDRVVPTAEVEAEAAAMAAEIARKPLHLITGLKKLLHHAYRDLPGFLEEENSVLLDHMETSSFRKWLQTCR